MTGTKHSLFILFRSYLFLSIGAFQYFKCRWVKYDGLLLTFVALSTTIFLAALASVKCSCSLFASDYVRSHAIRNAFLSLPIGVNCTEQSCHPSAVLSVSCLLQSSTTSACVYLRFHLSVLRVLNLS